MRSSNRWTLGPLSVYVPGLMSAEWNAYLPAASVLVRNLRPPIERLMILLATGLPSPPTIVPATIGDADAGYEVELVAGQEGVSPGQACVFYDAPTGQARVLGGGFIRQAVAAVECAAPASGLAATAAAASSG